ncbi:hypothetical protein N431DRAFT_462198 [Stipitochalara longipes BDJ]|nr:hypothetical protein N431DRAFT_462198 [Stipitochalara longipes BDJ]
MSGWSLISGNSSKANAFPSNNSEDDFTLVNHSSTSSASPNSMDPDVQVQKWLETQSEDMTANSSIANEVINTSVPEPVATPSTAYTGSHPEIRVYTIKITQLSKIPSDRNHGYFIIFKHPSTWYTAVVGKDTHSTLSSGIFTSIERAFKNHGDKGLLQIILWANVFNTTEAQQEFWKDVEEAALRRLPKQDVLVLVKGYMNSIKGRAGPRLAKKYDLETFFDGDSFYFAVKQNTGFEWMSPEEADNFNLERRLLAEAV